MSYNWEKIFKEKSDMELFNIYKGRTHLSGEAVEFAKKELENRNVDFNNLGTFIESVNMSNRKENLESVKNSVRSALAGAQIGLTLFIVFFISYFLNAFIGILEIFEPETFIFIVFVLLIFTGIEFIFYNVNSNKLKKIQKNSEIKDE